MVEIFTFSFKAAELKKLPDVLLSFLIGSSHFCNEINSLITYQIFEHSDFKNSAAAKALVASRQLTLDRILIGKIYEYAKFCDELFNDKERMDAFEPFIDVKAINKIVKEILETKWAEMLRHKISFHYDQKFALKAARARADDEDLRFLAGHTKGLNLYEFAEEVLSRRVFEITGVGTFDSGYNASKQFIFDAFKKLLDYHAKFLMAVFEKFNIPLNREVERMPQEFSAKFGEYKTPIVVVKG